MGSSAASWMQTLLAYCGSWVRASPRDVSKRNVFNRSEISQKSRERSERASCGSHNAADEQQPAAMREDSIDQLPVANVGEQENCLYDPQSGTDWLFAVNFTHMPLTETSISVIGSHLKEITRLEQDMEPLEVMERDLWTKYVRDNSREKQDLDRKELLGAYAERRSHTAEETRLLSALQKLQSLRQRKAEILNSYGLQMAGGLKQDTSIAAPTPATIGKRSWAILVGINHYTDGHSLVAHPCTRVSTRRISPNHGRTL
ncbi:hypothetical protein PENSPDRAFT_755972 [Peniophora sp. CONT]|nr:hypothetical protein PENSPDRAFT_755972 [Peniophora sp. CONT]